KTSWTAHVRTTRASSRSSTTSLHARCGPTPRSRARSRTSASTSSKYRLTRGAEQAFLHDRRDEHAFAVEQSAHGEPAGTEVRAWRAGEEMPLPRHVRAVEPDRVVEAAGHPDDRLAGRAGHR